jgi:hypothetical protein
MSEAPRLPCLVHRMARSNAVEHVARVPDGYIVTVAPPTRNLDQNAKFHAQCEDAERARLEWAGKPRTAEQWKVLFISGHAVATKQGSEMVPGLEGEFVNVRESSARMSKARASSLIEYTAAFLAERGVTDSGPHAEPVVRQHEQRITLRGDDAYVDSRGPLRL